MKLVIIISGLVSRLRLYLRPGQRSRRLFSTNRAAIAQESKSSRQQGVKFRSPRWGANRRGAIGRDAPIKIPCGGGEGASYGGHQLVKPPTYEVFVYLFFYSFSGKPRLVTAELRREIIERLGYMYWENIGINSRMIKLSFHY